MLITLYIYSLNPKVTRKLVLRFGLKAEISKSVQFDSLKKNFF